MGLFTNPILLAYALALFGLVVGAFAAPFLYRTQRALAIVLNVLGLLCFALPLGFVADGFSYEPSTEGFLVCSLSLALVFAGIEAAVCLALWLSRKWRENS